MHVKLVSALAGLLAVAALPALAQSAPSSQQPARHPRNSHFVDEVKLGVMAHDIPVFGSNKEEGVDINAEVLFESPTWMAWAFSPRPMAGFVVNASGDTSYLYLGLSWNFNLLKSSDGGALFIAPSFGGALHNGETDQEKPDRKALGSSVLFRESLDIGWRFASGWSVSAFMDHISNARLADNNEGLTNAGVRIGYRF